MIIRYIEKHPIISLILLCLLMLLPNLDSIVLTIMEARNFITAREMVTDGNWILTTMNGNPRYEKPPLPTWFTAISGALLGIKSLFALRLPAAIMVPFSGVFMYLFAIKLTKDKILPTIIGLIFITSFYIIGIINEAPWDIFTHGFMLAGIYFLFLVLENKNSLWKNVVFAGIFGGLSLMSKGPVSLYTLLLPFIISYGITYKFNNFKEKVMPLLSLIFIMLFIGGWWFIYVRITDNEIFTNIAIKETSRWGNYNVRPFYYYWSFFVQSGIWAILALTGLIYPYIIKRISNKKLYRFSFLWTIIALILLSIIPEKKSRYLVPVLFPLAINTGIYINYLIINYKNFKSKKDTFPVYFNFGLIGLLGFLIPFVLFFKLKDQLNEYWISLLLLSISLITIGIIIFKSLKVKNIKNAFYGQVFFMVTALLFGMPLQSNLYNNPDFHSISHLKNTIENQQGITSYNIGNLAPELLWYFEGNIINLYIDGKLHLPEEKKFGVLIEKRDLELLELLPDTYSIEHIDSFDMNYFKKKRERLKRDYFLISKNTIFD